MERRAFLSSVAAAACASSFAGRARGQTDDEGDAALGWGVPPYDAKRRRANPDGSGPPGTLADVEEAWRFDTEGATVPVVSGGTVYFGTSDGVTAVDSRSGGEVWSYGTEGEVREPPALHNGAVYAGTSEGRVVALGAPNGEERWSTSLDGAVTTSPMVDAVDLFVGTGDESMLYSLDVADGDENWSFSARVPVEAAPAVTEERVIYVDGALVFALDRFTGENEWRSYSGGTLSELAVGETRVYTVGAGTVYAQRLRNGVDRWSRSLRGDVAGGPVLNGSSMYVATDSGFLYSVDLNNDGFTEWEAEFPGGFVGSPVLVDATLYGVTLEGSEGRLHAVDPSSGESTGEYIIGREQVEQDGDDEVEGLDVELTGGPTVAGGSAYAASEEGVRSFGDVDREPPTASFEVSPEPPPVGELVSFDASGSSSGTSPLESYEWRFRSDAEGFTAGGDTYEEMFEEERDWTVSVTVTDEEGLSDTATREVSVGGSEGGGPDEGNTTAEMTETGNAAAVPEPGAETPGFLGSVGDEALLSLGAAGAVVSALAFSAYWRMEPEREKLVRREKNGGLCPDCGASAKPDDDGCRVCGTEF